MEKLSGNEEELYVKKNKFYFASNAYVLQKTVSSQDDIFELCEFR